MSWARVAGKFSYIVFLCVAGAMRPPWHAHLLMSARCGTLAPCPSCDRHVRVCSACCPFCAATLSADFGANVVPDTRARLHRAAIFFFASTVSAAAATAACGARTGLEVGEPDDAAPDGPDAAVAEVFASDTQLDAGPDLGEARDTGSWAGPYKAAPFGP